jgi:GTPase
MIHCGYIGIIGLPNAGKSSLLNRIIDEKVSIVSSKPQTTRQSFSGIWSGDDFQVIFYDAPGFVEKKSGLFEFLAEEFERVVEKSDQLIFMVSHEQRPSEQLEQLLQKLAKQKKRVHYCFSKVDLPPTPYVMELKKKLIEDACPVFELSLNDDHLFARAKNYLIEVAKQLPQEKQSLYDPEMISLDNVRDIASEYIRETCFENLEKEIPFGLGVIIKSFKQERDITRIEANIIVEKENHKSIVIGKGGQQLGKIGQQARLKIEQLLQQKVYLGLHVSHKKNWLKNKSIMKELGYKSGQS